MQTDDRIIRRVLDGHKDEFRQLVAKYQEQVFRAAFSVLRKREAAADVSQDTFVRAYQKLDTYDSSGPFGGWLRRIAVNLALRQMTRELPVEDIDGMAEFPHENWNPVETEVLRKMDASEVSKHLDALPEEHRAVLVLRYHNDLSYEEIAQALNEPISIVRYRLRYAKRMLTKRMAVDQDENM